jgi:hypothetical protein
MCQKEKTMEQPDIARLTLVPGAGHQVGRPSPCRSRLILATVPGQGAGARQKNSSWMLSGSRNVSMAFAV